MIDPVSQFGIRLQLFISGPDAPPRPAPLEVLEALISLQVTNNDRERDGFQLEFSLGKTPLRDYGLLSSGVLDLKKRVVIMAIFGFRPQVLIDGIITQHQVLPSNAPGGSSFHVTGEDISIKLSFEDRSRTFPNQSDSAIVRQILTQAGFIAQVTDTGDIPSDAERISTQHCNDLSYVQRLARRNGFIFFVEPTDVPGINTAYWGKENREGKPQAPLCVDLGAQTNVDAPIRFSLNALQPAEPEVSILDPLTKLALSIPLPTPFFPSLATQPAKPLRRTRSRDTAHLSYAQALLRALAGANESSDVVQASGEVDAVRYGRALRSRRLVDVAGAGLSYNGTYYVKRVVHDLSLYPPDPGRYRQQFELIREGRGATGISAVPVGG